MVSLHKALSESPRLAVPAEFEASSKKRKWEEPLSQELFKEQGKPEKSKSIFDVELHLETPLSSDKWQQCFNIQSGQLQFCNTKASRKSLEGLRRSPQKASAGHMSLDLELNLTCESLRKNDVDNYDNINEKKNSTSAPKNNHDLFIESSKHKKDSSSLARSPSWLSFEGDHKEMVTTVCMKCHMLVMLCKSSPACPNCKFVHPPDQNPSAFLKRRCSLLC